ncbi:response regulator [Thiotrichales bacterium 19X7-9]|nr:response regulator [Thiotrichales bacterium 19X7-9]
MTIMDENKNAQLSLLLEPGIVKSKFNISDKDLEILSLFGQKHNEDVDIFINDFYRWMQGLPEFSQFFQSSDTVERVKRQQIDYWHEFFRGQITSEYLKNRVRIGAVHANIGLPIHSYCAAMNYSSEWWKHKIESFKSETAKGTKAASATKAAFELASAFNKLIQLDITIITETYHQNTQKRLQETLKETQNIVHDVTKVAESVIQGDYSTKLDGETNLNIAINQMIDGLDMAAKENKREAWLKTGQAQLAEKLRGDLDMASLCHNTIEYIVKYLSAQVGVFYLLKGDQLILMGSYAYQHRKNLSNEFKIGEGIIGQTVLEKQSMIIENLPDDYLPIGSGLGSANARTLLIKPVVFEGNVKAIIEIGAFNKFEDIHLAFLDVVNDGIAVAIESAKSRDKMADLLKDSQVKSKELEAQSEKLEAINKDLEAQSEKIKASQEELKSQSDELQATNEELEEKTQALEEQKLDIERKNSDLEKSKQLLQDKASELQTSSKYKSEFLSNMSHELRTPLNSLLILAQSFMDNDDGNLSEDQIEKAGIIYNSGKDLLNLINDILDLSKVEAGKLKVELSQYSPETLVKSLHTSLDPLAKKNDINFKFNIGKTVTTKAVSDPMRLEQILKNLLSNAIKFTPPGGDVTLSVFKPEDDDHFSRNALHDIDNIIAFAVKDTGIGITKEDQNAIFEAFQQVDGATNRKYNGTGLGLTISRQLAQLLGGEIQLESEVDQGSTFTLLVPVNLSGDMKVMITESTHKSENQAKKSVSSSNTLNTEPLILVIEDDDQFKKILTSNLSDKKLQYVTTSTAKEGFEIARKRSPTAIILDVGLPDMSGLELLEQLKAHNDTKEIPVHIVSASDVKEKSITKGAVGFISKPLDKSKLMMLIDNASDVLQEPINKVLIVEDDQIQAQAIAKSIDSDHAEVSIASSAKEAVKILKSKRVHCMILDLKLPDKSGLDLLSEINNDQTIIQPAVIINTAKDITQKEEQQLNQYTPTIVLKGADSPQRLTDEVNLFLHKTGHKSQIDYSQFKTLKGIDLSGYKIMLVDDDMRNNIALGSYLRKHGLETVIADNGQLALDCLEDNQDVDLVLMDVMMPVMDGYTTMKKIRAQKAYQSLPIIALTAKAMSEDRDKCIKAGANDYLTKPVDLEKLFNLMNVWLKQ